MFQKASHDRFSMLSGFLLLLFGGRIFTTYWLLHLITLIGIVGVILKNALLHGC